MGIVEMRRNDKRDMVAKAKEFVALHFLREEDEHGYMHSLRTYKLAKKLMAKFSDVNEEVVELAALLHDAIGDEYDYWDDQDSCREIREFLFESGYPEDGVKQICDIIGRRDPEFDECPLVDETLEDKIVHDACTLDCAREDLEEVRSSMRTDEARSLMDDEYGKCPEEYKSKHLSILDMVDCEGLEPPTSSV